MTSAHGHACDACGYGTVPTTIGGTVHQACPVCGGTWVRLTAAEYERRAEQRLRAERERKPKKGTTAKP